MLTPEWRAAYYANRDGQCQSRVCFAYQATDDFGFVLACFLLDIVKRVIFNIADAEIHSPWELFGRPRDADFCSVSRGAVRVSQQEVAALGRDGENCFGRHGSCLLGVVRFS